MKLAVKLAPLPSTVSCETSVPATGSLASSERTHAHACSHWRGGTEDVSIEPELAAAAAAAAAQSRHTDSHRRRSLMQARPAAAGSRCCLPLLADKIHGDTQPAVTERHKERHALSLLSDREFSRVSNECHCATDVRTERCFFIDSKWRERPANASRRLEQRHCTRPCLVFERQK